MKKNKTIYKVYWIYDAAVHTNPLTEGYIGITTRSLQSRLSAHKNTTHSGQSKSTSNTIRHMRARIAAAEDIQIVELCRTMDEEHSATLERSLRPSANIGWNRYPGGKRQGTQRPIFCITSTGERVDYVSKSAASRDGFHLINIQNILDYKKQKFANHSQYGQCVFFYADEGTLKGEV